MSTKIALIISGGASRGSFQCGSLKALIESVPLTSISLVSASSIGTLNAYALLTGKLDKAEHLWRSIDIKNIFELSKVNKSRGLFEEVIGSLTDSTDNLKTPLFVSTCRLPSPCVCYWELLGKHEKEWNERLSQALSFPFLHSTGKKNKVRHIDGGMLDNVPVYPAVRNNDADVILIMHTDPKYRPHPDLYKNDRVVFDFVVNLDYCSLNDRFNFQKTLMNRNFEEGYRYGKYVMTRLFSNFDKERIRENAKNLYFEELEKRKKIFSLDTIATLYNNWFWNTYRNL